MADDALRMQAEIVDKFSGPLKNLQTQLRGISSGPGIANLKKDLETVQGHMGKLTTIAKDGLNPALATFGVTALGVSGALAGMAASLKGFSADTGALAFLSREVGISADKLRGLDALGQRFGLTQGQMAASTKTFADQLDLMHRNRGDAYNYLLQQSAKDPTGNVGAWTKSIKEAKSNAEAYQKTLEFIASIKDPLQRGDMAQHLLGDRSLGVLGSEGVAGLRKQQEEVEKSQGHLRKGAEDSAVAFNRSIDSMRETLRGLRDDFGADIIKPFNDGLRELGGWMRENRGEIEQTLVTGVREFGNVLRDTNWKEVGSDLTTVLHGVAEVAHATATGILAVVHAGERARAFLDRHGLTDPRDDKNRVKRIDQLQKEIKGFEADKAAGDRVTVDDFGRATGGNADAEIRKRQDEINKLTEELKHNTEEMKRRREREDRDGDKAKVDPSAFDGTAPGDAARILKASFGGGLGLGGRPYGGGYTGGLGGHGTVRDVPSAPSLGPVPGGVGRGASSAQIGRLARNANAQAIIGELRKAGTYNDDAIAAIVGSMQTESTFNPRAHNNQKGGHTGLWQWDRERWPRIERWIRSQKGDPYDAAWQTKAWIAEHNAKPGDAIYDNRNTERGGAILRRNPSLREAIEGVRQSERFGRGEEGGRAANAEKWLPHVRGTAEADTRRQLQDARKDDPAQPDTRRKLQDALKDDGKGETFPNGAPRVLIPKSMEGQVPGTVMDRGKIVGRDGETRRQLQAEPKPRDGSVGDGIKQIRPWTKTEPKPAEKRADLIGRAPAGGRLAGSAPPPEGPVDVHRTGPPGRGAPHAPRAPPRGAT